MLYELPGHIQPESSCLRPAINIARAGIRAEGGYYAARDQDEIFNRNRAPRVYRMLFLSPEEALICAGDAA